MRHWAYNICKVAYTLLLCFCLGSTYAALENTVTTGRYSFKELGLDDSMSLNPFRTNWSLYIPMQKNQRILDMELHLIVAFSPKLSQNSSLKVFFNQRQIQSIAPSFTNAQEEHTLILPATPNHTSAWQPLEFSAQFNPLQTFCDPESWVYISPKSYILLRFQEKPFTGKLSTLPYPFINKGSPSITKNLLLTRPQASLSEKLAALYAAFYLGQNSKDIPTSLTYATDKQDITFAESNHILVALDTAKALPLNAGFLAIQALQQNPGKAKLVISGNSEQGLIKAVQTLANPQYTALMPGNQAIVTLLQPTAPAIDTSRFFNTSLQKIGYDNQSVSGIGRHKLQYELPMQNNKTVLNGLVKTYITAPTGMDKQYYVTLLLNGQKQATTVLRTDHTQWRVSLPKAAFKPGVNNLSYSIDLHQAHETCSKEEFDLNWATLYANSEFSAQYQNTYPKANLNDFPVPFAGEVDFVVPEKLTSSDMQNLIPLIFKIGQLTARQAISLRIITTKALDEQVLASQNLILYGLPSENAWLAKTLDTMPVHFSSNARMLKSPEGTIQLAANTDIGMLQIQPSPWAKERSILMITANTSNMLSKTSQAFVSNSKRLDLNGNIAIINSGGQMQALQLYSGAYSDFTNRLMLSAKQCVENSLYYLHNNPEILLYILVFAVPLFIYLRRRKHEQS